MRVTPGANIPFWLKLWNGRADRYVLAHLSDTSGNPVSGSPFPLSYSGARGIYTAAGPVMGFSILVSDYEVYTDNAYTSLDTNYLPASDWVEPDVTSSNARLIYISTPLVGKIVPNTIQGEVLAPLDAYAKINQDKLKGSVKTPRLTGIVSTPELGESV